MECRDKLEAFGGHSMAIGLSIKKQNFEAFKQDFEHILRKSDISKIEPILNIDAELNIEDIDKNIVKSISVLEPFGDSNRMPVFAFKNLKIDSIRSLTDGKHLKLVLKNNNNNYINAIGFNMGYLTEEFKIGDRVDAAGNLELNTYNGNTTIQISLKDLIKSI